MQLCWARRHLPTLSITRVPIITETSHEKAPYYCCDFGWSKNKVVLAADNDTVVKWTNRGFNTPCLEPHVFPITSPPTSLDSSPTLLCNFEVLTQCLCRYPGPGPPSSMRRFRPGVDARPCFLCIIDCIVIPEAIIHVLPRKCCIMRPEVVVVSWHPVGCHQSESHT